MNHSPILQWTATAVTLLGAMLTAAALDPWNVYCLNAGSGLWLIWAWRVRSRSLIVVNAGLVLIYMAGLVRAFFA
jgi:hypothetical protein